MFGFEPIKKHKGIIVCGFAGIGKTNFNNFVPYYEKATFYDLKSSDFRKNEGWEKTYVDCAEALCQKYELVFVSTHDSVIDELIKRQDNFYIVYPKQHCKEEYKERFMQRGDTSEYIDKFMKNWDRFIWQIDRLNLDNKISLRTGQYLSDVISRIR